MLAALLTNLPAGHGKGFRRHYIPIESVQEHKEHTEAPKTPDKVEVALTSTLNGFLEEQERKDKKRRANNRKALMLWLSRN